MPKEKTKKAFNDSILQNLGNTVGSLDNGTVAIKVQDSKIIQIDVTKRKRYDEVWKGEEGAEI